MGNNVELKIVLRQGRHRAFTLVELLVAVGVIALLIAILVPSLGYARRRALSAACLSNTRQLGQSLAAYAANNNGLLFANDYTSTSGYWINQMAPYNTSLDNITLDQNGKVVRGSTNQNLVCPAAANFAYDIGNASQSWGPNVTSGSLYTAAWAANAAPLHAPGIPSTGWTFLDNTSVTPNVHYAGGYGLNAWTYNATFPQGSVMANNITGTHNSTFNAISVVTGSISAGYLYGDATAAGTITSTGGTGNRTPGASGIVLPNVLQIFNNLKATATTITTIDSTHPVNFTQNSVLYISGSPDLSTCSVIGSGVLLVQGSPTLPQNGQSINLVINNSASGSVVFNGTGHGSVNMTGDLYVTGDITSHGNPTVLITGLLISDGNLSLNGTDNWTITGGGLPAWGGNGYVRNLMGSAYPVVTFADSIWPEALPSSTDVPPTNPNGDITNQTGCFYVARHGNWINAVFSDGHAESVPLQNVTKLKWK